MRRSHTKVLASHNLRRGLFPHTIISPIASSTIFPASYLPNFKLLPSIRSKKSPDSDRYKIGSLYTIQPMSESEMKQSEAVALERKPTTEITMGKNAIRQATLRTSRGASAVISFYGGQVMSWKTEQGEELLFTSSKATFKPPLPVRGGIPICFPQFGSRGLLEQHGFARNRTWIIEGEEVENKDPKSPENKDPKSPDNKDPNPSENKEPKSPEKVDQKPFENTTIVGQACIELVLIPTADDLKIWNHKFEFRLKVSLTEEGNLKMVSRCRNANGKPFSFAIAFRTYFSISDISEVRVEGLETLDYLDNLCEKERFTEQGDALTFENEIDRVYLSSSDVVAIFDHGRKRTFQIRKQGLPDVAVWNPWEKKAKALTDIGDEEYKQMLCVDGAAVEKPITLKPNEEWTGQLELSVLSSC